MPNELVCQPCHHDSRQATLVAYLKLITFYSDHSLDEHRILLPKVLFLLKRTGSGVEDDDITSFWIPCSSQVKVTILSYHNAAVTTMLT